jgi:hypothetical protein
MDELSTWDGLDEIDESEEDDSELMLVSRSVHEAGHAVVALKLGLSIRFATIIPFWSCVGCVEARPRFDAEVLAVRGQADERQLGVFPPAFFGREQLLKVATMRSCLISQVTKPNYYWRAARM